MEDAAGWFNPDRGFILESEASLVKAQSFSQAVDLGADETWESLTMVVRILRKLGTQVPVKELSGPIVYRQDCRTSGPTRPGLVAPVFNIPQRQPGRAQSLADSHSGRRTPDLPGI